MNLDLKNILNNSNNNIDNQQLKDYLAKNKLSAEEAHEVEMQMAKDDFMNDAVEGLQQIKDEPKLTDMVDQLNKQLHKHIAGSSKKRKRLFKDQPNTYLAIIIILLLLMLSFVVVKKYVEAHHSTSTLNSNSHNDMIWLAKK